MTFASHHADTQPEKHKKGGIARALGLLPAGALQQDAKQGDRQTLHPARRLTLATSAAPTFFPVGADRKRK